MAAMKQAAIVAILIAALTLAAMGCDSGSPGSAAPADFYSGKTIELVVSSSVGGITDSLARIVASYLERDTGANVIMTNMKGAGGLDGMNYVYKSQPDGLTLGVVPSVKYVSNKVLDEPAAEYTVEESSYIFAIGRRQHYFMVSPDGPYQSVGDLRAGEDLKIGGSSASGEVSLAGLTVIELLDLDAKVVTGIDELADRALMAKRGEIAGFVNSISSTKTYLDAGIVKPLFVLSAERDPLMPDVPAITELADISGEDEALVDLWESSLFTSCIFVVPPGMPEDRLAFLRDLADEWVQEEDFREKVDTVSGYEEKDYIAGDEVEGIMLNVSVTIDAFRDVFADMIEKYRA
jgi:tripartite-type tricarboxylate transporter receptor subunit TctC